MTDTQLPLWPDGWEDEADRKARRGRYAPRTRPPAMPERMTVAGRRRTVVNVPDALEVL
ncbi:hypothetical protein [Streptomyces lateritius]|uniref:hypothetical protein n=1 Tax=Streptomyces lateritius TaxID=67313 RepID=UPI001C8CEB34|nr:hypothetical protein [Streptomyces lateritius]MBX9425467.1 hypothetical protein [Streptomyces lateritius]